MNALSVDRRRRRCTTMSAGSPISRRGACASSATPDKRIAEDYLRILRFFRFHAAYGHGLPDAAGLAACIAARAGLEQLSRERVRMELLKLLLARARDAGARGDGGVRPARCRCWAACPISRASRTWPRSRPRRACRRDAVQRLGALGARIAEDAERLWQRLRLSNAEHERLASMARRGGGFRPADEQGRRARCSIGSGRSVSSIACCWPGRARRRPRTIRPGARWRRCRSAGPRRCFRSRPPTSSSAACRRGRRSARLCMRPRRPGSRRISRPIGAAIAAIADAAAAEVRPM